MHHNDSAVNLVLQPGSAAVTELESCAAERSFQAVQVAVAFASEQGVDLLLSRLSSHADWTSAKKSFLVGIDYGLTQPEALLRLSMLPDTQVRIPECAEVLQHPALLRANVFHPKVFCFNRAARDFAIYLGSSNLTGSGLTSNTEAGAIVRGNHLSSAHRRSAWKSFSAWWHRVWDNAEVCTDSVLHEYRERRGILRRNSPDRFLTEEPSPSELAQAGGLWIEAGFLSGGSRNQLELPSGVEAFFEFPSAAQPDYKHEFQLATAAGQWPSWLVFWGNQVWRLRLPTEREGLGNYEGTLICFERLGPGVVGLQVAPADTPTAEDWVGRSSSRGTLRRTRPGEGGRDYGWF